SLATESICFLLTRLPPIATLFPYTTLFRSADVRSADDAEGGAEEGGALPPGAAVPVQDVAEPAEACRVAAAHGVVEAVAVAVQRSEEHTSELQSRENLVCRLLLEKKKKTDD